MVVNYGPFNLSGSRCATLRFIETYTPSAANNTAPTKAKNTRTHAAKGFVVAFVFCYYCWWRGGGQRRWRMDGWMNGWMDASCSEDVINGLRWCNWERIRGGYVACWDLGTYLQQSCAWSFISYCKADALMAWLGAYLRCQWMKVTSSDSTFLKDRSHWIQALIVIVQVNKRIWRLRIPLHFG